MTESKLTDAQRAIIDDVAEAYAEWSKQLQDVIAKAVYDLCNKTKVRVGDLVVDFQTEGDDGFSVLVTPKPNFADFEDRFLLDGLDGKIVMPAAGNA